MRGHGLTVIEPHGEAVTLLALRLEMLAKITLDATRAGGGPPAQRPRQTSTPSLRVGRGPPGRRVESLRVTWESLYSTRRRYGGVAGRGP